MTQSHATTAVVTGAGRGIGLAIAHRLAERGHAVCLTDLDGAAARAAAAEVGRGAWGLEQDVRSHQGHRDVATAAAERGRLAVWVNNAGVLFAGETWTHPDTEVDTTIDVNLRGVVAGCHAAVTAMADGGGSILNLASLSALTPVPGLAMYAATKAAVLSYTTSLQGDLDHAGVPVRVHALCPDVVRTSMVTSRAHDPGASMLFAGPKPLDADEVARLGVEMLDGHRLVRVVPSWRGAMARAGDLAPSVGLRLVRGMRRIGERRQRRG